MAWVREVTNRRNLLLILLPLILPAGCDDTPQQVEFGEIAATVVDPGLGPVADVDVTVTPDEVVLKTDETGIAVFRVPVGDHVVHARPCCAGPGGIQQDIPVAVKKDERVTAQFWACLVCL